MPTFGESLQLMMGACIEDNGDITCLLCGRPNEVCECGYGEELSYVDGE